MALSYPAYTVQAALELTPKEAEFMLAVAGDKEEAEFLATAKIHGCKVNGKGRRRVPDENADDEVEKTPALDLMSAEHRERLKGYARNKVDSSR